MLLSQISYKIINSNIIICNYSLQLLFIEKFKKDNLFYESSYNPEVIL